MAKVAGTERRIIVLSKWYRWWDDFWYELNAEFKRLVALFMRPMTWLVIGGLAALLAALYYGMILALRYDTLMHLLGVTTLKCRVLKNWQYLMLIYAILASAVALMYLLGNFVTWARAREHARQYPQESRSMAWKTFISVIGLACVGGLVIGMLLIWC